MSTNAAPEIVFQWNDGSKQHGVTLVGTFRWEDEFLELTGESFQTACENMGEQFAEFGRAENAEKAIGKAKQAYHLDPSEDTSKALEAALKESPEPKFLDPRWGKLCFDLFFAASAQWREESGWDRRNEKDGDDEKDPRKRGPYRAFLDRLRKPDVTRMQIVIFRLLYLYNYDPGLAAESNDGTLRPSENAAPPETSTTS